MPKIDLSMLNQRQTPAFYADVLANRPAAGFVGRIFVSTNTYAFYRDNGTSWDLIGGPGTGTVTGSGTSGQVTYWNGASTITGTNNLFYDAGNSRLGINNSTPGAPLDVHSSLAGAIIQANQTAGTNNTLMAFQNAGTSLWRIGSFYNAGANDFGVYDVVSAIQPVTIKKTTGQVLIGTSTIGSGKLVVASATSDNGIQIVGATAPSLRIDNAETGPTKRIGLGISTGVNNFIQGSVDRDMCIFNGSTTASPMLFGIYGTTNVVEAARISSTLNLLVGTTTDNGRKLQINGDASFATNGLFGGSNNPGNAGSYTVSVGVPGTTAGGLQLWAATNQSSFLQFGDGTAAADNYRGYVQYNHNTDSLILGTASADRVTIASTGNMLIGKTNDVGGPLQVSNGSNMLNFTWDVNGAYLSSVNNANTVYKGFQLDALEFKFFISASEKMRLASSTGNLLIGTTTDAGYKLNVNGTVYFNSTSYTNGIATFGSSGGSGLRIYGGSGTHQWDVYLNSTNLRISDNTSGGSVVIDTPIQIANTVTAAVGIASTHKVSILINGVQYYLLASNV